MKIPSFSDAYYIYKLKQFYFKKDHANTSKYNHKCTKEISLMLSRRFSKPFLNEFYFFKMKKKIDKYGLNCHRYMAQSLVLCFLQYSFRKSQH